jgi:hypothetical protein
MRGRKDKRDLMKTMRSNGWELDESNVDDLPSDQWSMHDDEDPLPPEPRRKRNSDGGPPNSR